MVNRVAPLEASLFCIEKSEWNPCLTLGIREKSSR